MTARRVAVIGIGYVGLVSAACLSDVGHHVVCIDRDQRRLDMIRDGRVPFYEPGLGDVLRRNVGSRLTVASSCRGSVEDADILMIAVGTPPGPDGDADLSALWAAAAELRTLTALPPVVVIKSTVPVGTGARLEELLRDAPTRHGGPVAVVSNPEFLREGRAVSDFMGGDRIVVGSDSPEALESIRSLYSPIPVQVVTCSRSTAELTKYASNAFLALKISYINMLARLCQSVGANVTEVALAMGLDRRIARGHLSAGLGYGGSCFPKDVSALIHMLDSNGVDAAILEAAVHINDTQPEWVVSSLEALLPSGLQSAQIGLLGIAFKPDTDDVRDTPYSKLASRLAARGARLRAYDPVASGASTSANVTDTLEHCAEGCDALVVVTEWDEFLRADWSAIAKTMRTAVLVDARNCLSPDALVAAGFLYQGVGVQGSEAISAAARG